MILFNLSPRVALQLEVDLARKGWRLEGSGGGYNDIGLTYLDLPLLLRLAAPQAVSPYAIAGLGAGVFLDGGYCRPDAEAGGEVCADLDARNDAALIAGIGVEASRRPGAPRFFLELRLWHGLTKVLVGDEGCCWMKNRVLALSLGFYY